jgi:hypothetical protein
MDDGRGSRQRAAYLLSDRSRVVNALKSPSKLTLARTRSISLWMRSTSLRASGSISINTAHPSAPHRANAGCHMTCT